MYLTHTLHYNYRTNYHPKHPTMNIRIFLIQNWKAYVKLYKKFLTSVRTTPKTEGIPIHALSVPSQSRYKCIKCYYHISHVSTTKCSRITSDNSSEAFKF